jgi:hypothetical protein
MKATSILLRRHARVDALLQCVAERPEITEPHLVEVIEEASSYVDLSEEVLYPAVESRLPAALDEERASLERIRLALFDLATCTRSAADLRRGVEIARDALREHALRVGALVRSLEQTLDTASLVQVGLEMTGFLARETLRLGGPAA